MPNLVFTTQTLVALNRLAASIYKETGQRFELAKETSLLGLLALSAASSNESIRSHVNTLLHQMNELEMRQLSERGLDFTPERLVKLSHRRALT